MEYNSGQPSPSDNIIGLRRNLFLRIVSSLVILPPVAALLLLGGSMFALLVAVIAVCIAWEWSTLVSRGGMTLIGSLSVTGCAGLVLCYTFLPTEMLSIAIFLSVTILAGATMLSRERDALWVVGGCIISATSCLSILWLRESEPDGLFLVTWLISIVIATDVSAYVTGRAIGGPRLAPRISPNKTWAGLLGGIVASAVVGVIFAVYTETTGVVALAMLSAAFACVAQCGDLLVSVVKRKFGVKDSSRLIPGHGGVLDRLDGHIAVQTLAALGVMISERNLLMW